MLLFDFLVAAAQQFYEDQAGYYSREATRSTGYTHWYLFWLHNGGAQGNMGFAPQYRVPPGLDFDFVFVLHSGLTRVHSALCWDAHPNLVETNSD